MLVEGGGVVVLARDASGRVVTVADTRSGLEPVTGARDLAVVHEGAEHGLRYPSARADDDDDGKVNEDCLDGLDNDGDGKVDEDYAAIGDEMIVIACNGGGDTAPAVGEGQPGHPDGGGPSVTLRQECYAWSLAHIDGMVAMKITVRNTGSEPLADVRLGAVLERPGPVQVSTESLDSGTDAYGLNPPLDAKAMTIGSDGAPAVAAVFASPRGGGEASWLTGELRGSRSLADVVRAAERPDALARPDRAYPRTDDTDMTAIDSTADNDRTFAFGVSPVLGTLEPGQETEVYLALVTLDDRRSSQRAIESAYRTIEGDTGHRMIPPPMSITRRTLWGSYRLRVPDDASAGVTLTISNPRARGVDPAQISRLEGIDLRRATRTTTPAGDLVFEITGEVPRDIAATERVVLTGQTSSGTTFNAVLRPTGAGPGLGTVEAATRYWNTAGKLDEALLSNSPNPFRVATTITYQVPAQLVDENGNEFQFSGQVDASVKVYNVAGRLVSTLVETTLGPGNYDVQWNASNTSGDGVASGVYYVKLQIGKRFVTKRLIQLK
jgi:hypothetical protein